MQYFFIIIIQFALGLCKLSDAADTNKKVLACYVNVEQVYKSSMDFKIDHLQPELCTHLLYGFATIDKSSWSITSSYPKIDLFENQGYYRKITTLREKFPHLKVILSVAENTDGGLFLSLTRNPEKRQLFIDSLPKFLSEHNFDGLDIAWDNAYFGTKYDDSDRADLVTFLKELNIKLKQNNYTLTVALILSEWLKNSELYMKEIANNVDYIFFHTYSYHQEIAEEKNKPTRPLICDCSIEDMIRKVLDIIPSTKTIFGLEFKGTNYLLLENIQKDESPFGKEYNNTFLSNLTSSDGLMNYNEICYLENTNKNWRSGWDNEYMLAYIINGQKVVIFDDSKSIEIKVNYVSKYNLAGIMVNSIDEDDFLGNCTRNDIVGHHTDYKHPLLRTTYNVLYGLKKNIACTTPVTGSEVSDSNSISKSDSAYGTDTENGFQTDVNKNKDLQDSAESEDNSSLDVLSYSFSKQKKKKQRACFKCTIL